MNDPASPLYPSSQTEETWVLFRIISRKSWDDLQSLHESFPGSRVEKLMFGLYVLIIGPGGDRRLTQ